MKTPGRTGGGAPRPRRRIGVSLELLAAFAVVIVAGVPAGRISPAALHPCEAA